MKNVYVIPFECVEHLYDDESGFTNRAKVKRIGKKCGEVLSLFDFQAEFNKGNIDTKESVILIDGE